MQGGEPSKYLLRAGAPHEISWHFLGPFFVFFFVGFSYPVFSRIPTAQLDFGVIFGRLSGVKIGHFGHRFFGDFCISAQERPESAQEAFWGGLWVVWGWSWGVLGRSHGGLGAVLGWSWGGLWAIWWLSWGILGCMGAVLKKILVRVPENCVFVVIIQ